jgi:protease I
LHDAPPKEVDMRVACVLAEGFEDSEFRVPYDKLKAAGHDVVVVGATKDGKLEGKKGKEAIVADAAIDDVRPESFDALFIPGGHSPDHLRADPRFVEFVRGFRDKPVLAICHGPQLLITADMVHARTLTAWKTVQVDLRNAGAMVVDRDVCVDRNFVTSRKPEDLDAFVRASLLMLSNGARAYA